MSKLDANQKQGTNNQDGTMEVTVDNPVPCRQQLKEPTASALVDN